MQMFCVLWYKYYTMNGSSSCCHTALFKTYFIYKGGVAYFVSAIVLLMRSKVKQQDGIR